MSKVIDTKKKVVRFYDDRNKGEERFLNKVLFEDKQVVLCKSEDDIILFDKKTGEVLTSNFEFYKAENV